MNLSIAVLSSSTVKFGLLKQPLHRASLFRKNDAFISDKINAPDTKFLLFNNMHPLVEMLPNVHKQRPSHMAVFSLSQDVLNIIQQKNTLSIFLGLETNKATPIINPNNGQAWFALSINDSELLKPLMIQRGDNCQLLTKRLSLVYLPDFHLWSQARSLIAWNLNYCGSPTLSVDAGHKRICTNQTDCRSITEPGDHSICHPRTDPAIITMICTKFKGIDYCLLAAKPQFPKNRVSCLAGFLEPGENFEEALAREVEEEVGLNSLSNIRYIKSHPWPFPSSIMIGCSADIESTNQLPECVVNADELSFAKWFSKSEVSDMVNKQSEWRIPPKQALAHHLILDWLSSS